MTNGKRRRVSLVLLGACLALMAAIGWQLWHGVSANRVIEYSGDTVIAPVPSEVCPGESFVYHQAIHAEKTAMVDISRDWCNRGGTCSLALHESWQNVVLTPLDFSGPVTRTVPVSSFFKAGGLYEFRSGVRNGELSVQIVEFSIRDDCEVNNDS